MILTQEEKISLLARYSVIAERGKQLSLRQGAGVAPLLELLGEGLLEGADVTDRVIGRAAAFVLAAGGVRSLYARVLSDRAVPVLERYGISYAYDTRADHIVNRAGDGMCPMEEACLGAERAEDALAAIRAKLAALRAAK